MNLLDILCCIAFCIALAVVIALRQQVLVSASILAHRLGIKSRRQSADPHVGLPTIPMCPPWTAHDRDWWLAVLNHERGKKLIARIRAVEYALAVANAKDTFHTQHSAGVVAGYGEAIKSFLSLASACEAEPIDARKDTRTQAEREMDELVARISP